MEWKFVKMNSSKMLIQPAVFILLRYIKVIIIKLFSPFHIVFLGTTALMILFLLNVAHFNVPLRHRSCPPTLWADELDEGFEGFDNVSGIANGPYIVPNYVHFLRYGEHLNNVSFMDAVNILAAFRNQVPDKIFFHTNLRQFTGKYWDILMGIPGFKEVIHFQYIEPVDSIFSQKLNGWYSLWHSSDILRIDILRRFGGIFIDNDVYIVKNLDPFRRFEMTIELIEEEKAFGTMTLIAHKNARFLKLWLVSYREYYGHLWYYNAGEKPKREIFDSRPELVHNVDNVLGVKDLRHQLYIENWNWKSQYTIHTLIRHLWYVEYLLHNSLNLKYPVTFNEKNIIDYNVTILDMVLDCCKELLN